MMISLWTACAAPAVATPSAPRGQVHSFIFSVAARRSGQMRFFVRENSNGAMCLSVVGGAVAPGPRVLYIDE